MTVTMMIKLDEDTNERMKVIAKANRRSKSQEIVVAIEKYVELGGQVGNSTYMWTPSGLTSGTSGKLPATFTRPPGDAA